MQIVETLVFETQNGLFEKLSNPLPLTSLGGTDIPTYRLEVDPELVIFIYLIEKNKSNGEQFLANLMPYIKTTVILTRNTELESLELPAFLLKHLNDFEERAPITLALVNKGEGNGRAEYLREHGFYLAERSRLVLLDEDDKENRIQVWKIAWGELLRAS